MSLDRRALGAGTGRPIASVRERAKELYESAERWHDQAEVGDHAEEQRTWRVRSQAGMTAVGSYLRSAP